MLDNIGGILLVAAFTGVVFLIRYVVRSAVNKGADVIQNAIAEKKNMKNEQEPTNLADKYRK